MYSGSCLAVKLPLRKSRNQELSIREKVKWAFIMPNFNKTNDHCRLKGSTVISLVPELGNLILPSPSPRVFEMMSNKTMISQLNLTRGQPINACVSYFFRF